MLACVRRLAASGPAVRPCHKQNSASIDLTRAGLLVPFPHTHRYTDGDEEDIPLQDLPNFLVKPLPPLPESELQRPKGKGKAMTDGGKVGACCFSAVPSHSNEWFDETSLPHCELAPRI